MIFKKIIKKEVSNFKGKVYDLTVDSVHSYNLDGLIVHNSGAGSLVNYALGITQVNPLDYDLIFERFLNPDRGHLPDIDSDFCIFTGYKVFEHLNEKYGKSHCCNIITFSKLQARAIIKDVARAFNVPLSEVNEVTKMVPKDLEKFSDLLQIKEINAFFNKYSNLYEYCEKLYGAPRHHSQHPAGICVTPMPITDLLPVENAAETPDGFVGYMSQYEKEQTEQMGAVKLDILKLSNISALYNQMAILNKVYNVDLKLENIPFDDDKTWDLICSGDTMGIFQMASPVGKNVIKQIQPRNIEELSAVNAFVRPGTSGLEEYCLAKKDPTKIRKFHPKLDKHLAATMGGIVYQEQIMSLIAELLGVSFGKADIYRRALEKPNKGNNGELVKEFERLAVEEGVKNGIDEESCKAIRKVIIDNSAYLFNKSHSIAYSFISYWTAWVKANYPLIFYVSLFNTESIDKIQECIQEAKRRNIIIAPPSISKSKFESTIEDKENNVIRMGLSCVKGIGEKAVDYILPEQPFNDLEDFFTRCSSKGSGKGVVDPGINIGAFEDLPLIIHKSSLKSDLTNLHIEEFNDDENNDKVKVYLNRSQQLLWYSNYLTLTKSSSISNYAIPQDLIAGKYLNDSLIFDKIGTLVIPGNMLEKFGFKEDDVLQYKTRCKPKGSLKQIQKQLNISKFEYAFIKSYDKIIATRNNNIMNYLNEIKMFDISFINHPLEKLNDKIQSLDSVNDDDEILTAGIVVDIIDRQTKRGKTFKNIIIQTPRESVRLTIWDNIYNYYKDICSLSSIIRVKGIKKFGGVTVNSILQCAFVHK